MSAMIIILGMALPILIVGLFAYFVYLTKGAEREHPESRELNELSALSQRANPKVQAERIR